MLETGLLLTGCTLFGAAAVYDLRFRSIPDRVPLGLLAVFGVYAGVADQGPPLWAHLATAVVLLLVGFGLFAAGALGGGDGKLLAGAGLWVGPLDISLFLAGLGLLSLGLGLLSLLPLAATRRLRSNLPLAVAIAPPAIVVLSSRACSA